MFLFLYLSSTIIDTTNSITIMVGGGGGRVSFKNVGGITLMDDLSDYILLWVNSNELSSSSTRKDVGSLGTSVVPIFNFCLQIFLILYLSSTLIDSTNSIAVTVGGGGGRASFKKVGEGTLLDVLSDYILMWVNSNEMGVSSTKEDVDPWEHLL